MPRGKPFAKGNKAAAAKNKETAESALAKKAAKVARKLTSDPAYLKVLQEQLRSGKAHPSVQTMLWDRGWGKTKEVIETQQVVPVTIVHEFAEGTEE